VAPLEAEGLDVGSQGFADPEPIDGQQRDQGVLCRPAEAGGYEEGADLVAVEAGGVGLVVEAGPTDMNGRGSVEEAVLFGVAVEPGHRGQASGDGGPGPAELFEVAGEALDVSSADIEQAQLAALAPGDELAQIEGVGVTGQPAVAGQEAGEGELLGLAEHAVGDDDGG